MKKELPINGLSLTDNILVEDVMPHLKPMLVFTFLSLRSWSCLQYRRVTPHLLPTPLLRHALKFLLTLTRCDISATRKEELLGGEHCLTLTGL